MSDPYVYPGTKVLKNKADVRTATKADLYERLVSQERSRHIAAGIRKRTIVIQMSPKGYKELHRQIFQDVYDWAGKTRTVNIAKKSMFCLVPYIENHLKERFALINKENDLKGLPAQDFASRAAEHIAEINAIHPFREGNGRTQRLFLKALAHQAGHDLSLTRIEADAWHEASIKSFHGDYDPMRRIIAGALTGRDQSIALAQDSGNATPEPAAKQAAKKGGWKERGERLAAERGITADRSSGYRRSE